MIEKKTAIARFVCSAAAGWLAVLLAQFPLVIDRTYDISICWSLIFPTLAALAWGGGSALVSCTAGAVWAVPFVMCPEYGYGNILFAAAYVILVLLTGFFFSENGRFRLNVYVGMLVYSACGFFLINSIMPQIIYNNSTEYKRFVSPKILGTFSLGFFISAFLVVLAVRVILYIPAVRRLLRIRGLPYAENNAKVLLTAMIFCAVLFVADLVADNSFFSDRGLHTSLLFSTDGSRFKTLLVIMLVLVVCDYVIYVTMRTTQSNASLLNSEERYRTVFNNMIDAYIEIDHEGKILCATPSVLEIFSHDNTYVTGRAFSQFFEFPDEAAKYVRRLFDAENLTNIEMTSGRGGEKRILLLSGKVVYRAEIRSGIGVITIRNITDYKKNDEKRKQLSAMTNAIFESNRDLIWVMNGEDFSLISSNTAFKDYISETRGIAAGEGSTLDQLFNGKEARVIEHYCYTVIQQGKFFADFETRSGKHFELSFYPVRVSSRILNISVFAKDMTQQLEAERRIVQLNEGLEKMVDERTAELKEAYKDLESYSYTVTHEFKTPVREIDAYMSVLEEDNADILPQESVRDIRSVRKICSETLDMIQKMMVYSKAGYMVLNIEKVNMEQLVRECFSEESMGRRFPCELDCRELPPLDTDEFLMRVAIANIISNSVKFSEKKGKAEIFVGYMRSSETVTYYFTDKGAGFRQKDGASLFGLYNRAHNSGEFDGSGIGLAVVKKVCERVGGEAYIFGKENVGCTVAMEFKRRDQA